MKIAVVHPKFDRRGGAERYALGLVEGLAARGHAVQVFARRAPDLPAGVALSRLPALALGRTLKTWSFCREAARRVRPERFDIVQGFGKTTCQTVHRTGGGVHRAFMERRGGPAEATLYDRAVLRIEDALFASPRLAAVICPSRWVAGEVARFYPAVAGKLRVIANGVEAGRFAPEGRESDRAELMRRLALPAGTPVLLFVATNFRLKGLGTAVAALRELPGTHLVVAGGDAPDPFLAQARELGVAAQLHFLGPVEDPAALYRAADVLVHPTRYDPFANVSLEALACGTPVVTTVENGVADLIAETAAGRVLRAADDPADYAEAARELIAGGAPVRARAREIAVANDQQRHLDRVLALYAEVLASSPRGAPARAGGS